MPVDLFDHAQQQDQQQHMPLAARLRPRTLDEFVGQTHLLGPGKPLHRLIAQHRRVPSLILWGPPGTGKTTLAHLLARSWGAHFIALSAVLSGKRELRQAIDTAREQRKYYNRPTVLFVDEVHRWNKAQQDALLPYVEDGTLTFLGATTENPYFEVIPALVSRSRVFQLQPLTVEEVLRILQRALTDPRGYGGQGVQVAADALQALARWSGGDARWALNALELAVESAPATAAGQRSVDLPWVEAVVQRRAVRHDKGGDWHYDRISAFIKSVRGSDPDAALYWLAALLEGGEDPRFIWRRLLILAAEDIGLADPQALVHTVAAAQAFDRVGLPEGLYHLAQATLYLATAPKSNSTKAIFAAQEFVRQHGIGEVPLALRDAHRDGQALGHGQGYRYPHDAAGHFVRQTYRPPEAQGARFYAPSDQGYERVIAQRLRAWWGPGEERAAREVETTPLGGDAARPGGDEEQ